MDFMGLLQGLSTNIRPLYMIIQTLNWYISFNYYHYQQKKIFGFEQEMCFFRRLLVCFLVAQLEILIVDLVISIRRVVRHTLRNTSTLLVFSIPFQLHSQSTKPATRTKAREREKKTSIFVPLYKCIGLQVHIVQISCTIRTLPFIM